MPSNRHDMPHYIGKHASELLLSSHQDHYNLTTQAVGIILPFWLSRYFNHYVRAKRLHSVSTSFLKGLLFRYLDFVFK